MRLSFVGTMAAMALVFGTSAWAEETSTAPEMSHQERCDAAGTEVETAGGELELVVRELEGVEKQIAELRQQKKELTVKRDAMRQERSGKRVVVNKAERKQRAACKEVVRCRETNRKVLASKKVVDTLVRDLDAVGKQAKAGKEESAALKAKLQTVQNREAELKCRKLKPKGQKAEVVNECHDLYENYGQLKRELVAQRKALRTVEKGYKKLATKHNRKQEEMKYLARRVQQNCAADGPERKEVEYVQARKNEFDGVADDLKSCKAELLAANKVRVKKPKPKRVESTVAGSVKVSASASAKVKAEAKGSTKKAPKSQANSKSKSGSSIKIKGGFDIGGEVSGDAKAKGKSQVKSK